VGGNEEAVDVARRFITLTLQPKDTSTLSVKYQRHVNPTLIFNP